MQLKSVYFIHFCTFRVCYLNPTIRDDSIWTSKLVKGEGVMVGHKNAEPLSLRATMHGQQLQYRDEYKVALQNTSHEQEVTVQFCAETLLDSLGPSSCRVDWKTVDTCSVLGECFSLFSYRTCLQGLHGEVKSDKSTRVFVMVQGFFGVWWYNPK